MAEMQWENATLRARADQLTQNQAQQAAGFATQQAQIKLLQQFMEEMRRNQTGPSTSGPPVSTMRTRRISLGL